MPQTLLLTGCYGDKHMETLQSSSLSGFPQLDAEELAHLCYGAFPLADITADIIASWLGQGALGESCVFL